jgi:outer membrane protein
MKRENRWFGTSLVLAAALFINMGIANMVMAEKESPLKIGFVDIGKIMKESKAANNARAIFKKDLDAKQATIKEKSDKVANLEKELKKADQKSAVWNEKREKLAQEIKELKRMGSDMDEQLKKKDAELTQKILVDIQQIIKQFSKNENYSIIFEKKAALEVVEGLDVTDKIIKIYDAQKK